MCTALRRARVDYPIQLHPELFSRFFLAGTVLPLDVLQGVPTNHAVRNCMVTTHLFSTQSSCAGKP